MERQKLRYFANRLNEEEKRIRKQLETLEHRNTDYPMASITSELSSYDNHPADMGSEMFERSKDIALSDNLRVLLNNIKRAQQAIETGKYGLCERCQKPISVERLEAVPWATECVECQLLPLKTAAHKRPLEEQVLSYLFARNDKDDDDYTGFDGEDALQAVQRYGSSDTVQDLPGLKDYEDLDDSERHSGIVDPADAIPDNDSEY